MTINEVNSMRKVKEDEQMKESIKADASKDAKASKDASDKKINDISIKNIVDDPFIKDYSKYVEYLQRNQWMRENVNIHEYLSSIATINTLKAGNEGIVIDIRCPPGHIISIMGKNNSVLSDINEQLKLSKAAKAETTAICCPSEKQSEKHTPGYNIERHLKMQKIKPFELKLANSDGVDIGPYTNIKIVKDKVLKMRTGICVIPYECLCMLNYSTSPNKFKAYNELYRFDQGIELKGEDHLRIYAISPDIDIDIIKFNLRVDLWIPAEYFESAM